MTRTARIASAPLLLSLILGAALFARTDARAMAGYTVTATPTEDTVAVGSTAVFRVKVQGQTASLPSFNFDVEGGTLSAVTSLDPTAANVAEGAVFVTRENEGTARLTVRFGGEVLATSEARFARMGTVNVSVTLNAGPDAAARTWRYEVLSPSGQVVASLSANTSGDLPNHTVSTPSLPYGQYTVRQVLGSDTGTACASGVFYQVGASEAALELASGAATVQFTIVPCPALPTDLGVVIPIDTLAPGETPVSEVRGARDEGPGATSTPLPPRTGNSLAGPGSKSPSLFLFVLLSGAAMTILPVAAWSLATVRNRDDR